jgi:hypothetical protein
MSSLGNPAVGGEGVLEKRGPGRPKGSGKKTEAPEMSQPTSWKCGRPKGSRNHKTLEALAAAAAAAPPPLPRPGQVWLLVARVPQRNEGLAARGGAGGKPRPQQRPPLRRLAAADRRRAAKIRGPLLPLRPLPLTLRGPMRQPLPQLVRHGSGRRNRHSSRRPTSRPRGGLPE